MTDEALRELQLLSGQARELLRWERDLVGSDLIVAPQTPATVEQSEVELDVHSSLALLEERARAAPIAIFIRIDPT
ncbi:MAG: hypothetical protein R3A47_08395 [Polyangiales bacterium]